ncbi:zinc finger BED domain-containing 4-like protein [Labeo rohita]|nr:zinc finger BED domain-containing 4-like protein [Labeo rohita]
MVKGMRLAELPDLSCTARTLQLIVNEGLSSQRAVLDIIAILKSCATHFGHSVLAKQRLRAIQEEVGVPVHNIIQAVPTRWNSTLHMLQRMYEQRRALNVYAGEHGHISCLSATQWDIVCNLIDTLAPIEEVTMEMSNSETSAACIIPSVSVLKLMLREEGPSSAGIKTLRKTMLDSLTRRFSKAEETKILVLATLLDPRYKARAFASEETLEKGKKWLKDEAEEFAKLRDDDPCPPLEGPEQDEGLDPETKKQKIHQPTLVDTLYARVLGATAVSHEMYSFETEPECYLSEPVIERSDMPLQWWQNNETRFKTLAHLAKKFLCPPPSTVPSERVFSEVGMLYEARRSRLTGHHAHQLCFLHYNLRLLNFEY